MALYNLTNPLDAERFTLRTRRLIERRAVVELTEKKPRSQQQNRYLHVCLGYFGALTGYPLEYVKTQYFKRLCNPDIFIISVADRFCGSVKMLRSSASLTTEEMTLAIDRFRDWAAQQADIYIPTPEDHDALLLMEIEIDRAKQYLLAANDTPHLLHNGST